MVDNNYVNTTRFTSELRKFYIDINDSIIHDIYEDSEDNLDYLIDTYNTYKINYTYTFQFMLSN